MPYFSYIIFFRIIYAVVNYKTFFLMAEQYSGYQTETAMREGLGSADERVQIVRSIAQI